jgi:serine/threonine protein kinase
MAEVWKARINGGQTFQRLVVVKRILPHLSSDPTFVRMFTDEAAVSSRLNHPNIVQVFEFAQEAGEHYLAMEYVHGVNVGDVQKRLGNTQVPIGMAAHIVREVCLALAYAHDLRDDDGKSLAVIHRDVSPSNVMIGYDGAVKLVDFGVAKVLCASDELTRTGALKGKVSYMSPEAVDGDVELDGRSDLFAAGVLLHELLTGRRLFKGHDDLKTIALVRACRVPHPSSMRDGIPRQLDRIAEKALARDREQRYPTALELAADLGQVVREIGWDAAHTARFLKDHQIQPGSEPELLPIEPSGSVKTRHTKVERRRPSSNSGLPAVSSLKPKRPVFKALGVFGALGVLGFSLAVAGGWRLVPGKFPTSAAAVKIVEPPAANDGEATPASTTPPPTPLNEKVGLATERSPAPAPVIEREPVKPKASRGKLTAAATDHARDRRNKRRRKPPRRAQPPVSAVAPSPTPANPATANETKINLKRGDVVPTF